jgi:hypothetical protein
MEQTSKLSGQINRCSCVDWDVTDPSLSTFIQTALNQTRVLSGALFPTFVSAGLFFLENGD